ncbi:preprotein translocase, SecG subunit [Segniliparus rugosus ATCC BAA-974]|uniref:Protein-export membrane protein SecG n=1 Tax=Segniliparus rugosus (strain ATCC BAA-974 / DSM 45345 / CCUG 50838 / CIP 108380 / JCM 13579 / CDC 945) TaxID=679197 RepID=E5XLC6_SEGRC|nr:preprotein translocase, SecG subunit [Segniliparus rugosus ATCC BAA-974]
MRLTLEITILVSSLLLVLLVLLHRGKGGGLSSLFGGGVQSSLAGSTQAERNLNRITIFVGLVWFVAITGISYQIKLKTEQDERRANDPGYSAGIGGGMGSGGAPQMPPIAPQQVPQEQPPAPANPQEQQPPAPPAPPSR